MRFYAPLSCVLALNFYLLISPVIAQISDQWNYTTTVPADGWQASDFDDSQWKVGAGGFGTIQTPNARVGTVWNSSDIWLRKEFNLDTLPNDPALYIHHDEDAEVYLNGVLALTLNRWSVDYESIALTPDARRLLQVGKNVLAIHCKQTNGGQFIDAHIIQANQAPILPFPRRDAAPFKSALITEWGSEVTADNVWQEYPRPQLVRPKWTNLNGHWNYAIVDDAAPNADLMPQQWDGQILVPFCPESKLSGVGRMVDPYHTLWYERSFEYLASADSRTLLNFEAVDYSCQVTLNGKFVGSHKGGNDPFHFDITDALVAGTNVLAVQVDDNTEEFQLNGKQRLYPSGIWYTQVSGIWQTVWLEDVPKTYISDLNVTTDAEAGSIAVAARIVGEAAERTTIKVQVMDAGDLVSSASGSAHELQLVVPNAKRWTPSTPHLYDLAVKLFDAEGKLLDEVNSYTGIRSVGKVRDAQGHMRYTLNGQTLFHWGPLDQGWWPDGLLTPPSDEAMLSDIEYLKAAGFNMIRKHIKVEPRRYYYHCDRLGMMVWQDQVSGGKSPPWTRMDPNPSDAEWPPEAHGQFLSEFDRMVDNLGNHPCIVVWTPFNEAWGQHQTVEVGKWIRERDPKRLINIASGGNFWPVGDTADHHAYPHPEFPFNARFNDFVKVVGEFGGHGFPVKGHLWDADRENWGYGGLPETKEEYLERYRTSIVKLAELQKLGIAAGVYTQTTDVEGEINGLLTYDRKEVKIPAEELSKLHGMLFEPAKE